MVLGSVLLIAQSAEAQLTMATAQARSGRTGGGGTGTSGAGGGGAAATGGALSTGLVFQNNSSTTSTARTGGMRGGMGGFGGFGGFGGLGRFGTSSLNANRSSQRPTVRTRLASAIELPAAGTAAAIAAESRVATRVATSPARRIVNGYEVDVVDGVATISGVANDAHDRRMAELLLKLEPGVRSVDNQIVIAQ